MVFFVIPLILLICYGTVSSKIYNGTFGCYHIVKPGSINKTRSHVPNFIRRPLYYKWGTTVMEPQGIIFKNDKQITKARRAGKLARYILFEIGRSIQIGNTTEQIDKLVHHLALYHGAYPSPLNYGHYPKSVCTAVNNVACHGIPDDRRLRNGDIITVDVSVYFDGFHGDCADTFLIGKVDDEGKRLVNAAYEALQAGIRVCKPGQYFKVIGRATEAVAKRYNYSIVKSILGHGIGYHFHESPDVFHYSNNGEENQERMQPGMMFTIEPILAQGDGEVVTLKDGFTITTKDQSRTAQWEQTLLITSKGVEVLTRVPRNLF